MFDKIQLFVMVGLLFLGCKNIGSDDLASNDDDDRPSSPWAMVDLSLDEPDDDEDAGEVNLTLSSHLAQDSDVNGVVLQFEADGSLEFTAPDANNVATPIVEGVLISRVIINLRNSEGETVCPDNPIVAGTLAHDDTEEGVIFSAMDLACAGNKKTGINTLADSIAKLAGDAWPEDHEEVLKEVDEFYKKESEKGSGGALHKGKHQATNEVIDDFLIRRKMLKGYAAMYSQLEGHPDLDLAEIKNKAKEGDSRHVVIPATLSSFLDARVNNRVTPDDSTGGGGKIDLLLMKEAIGNAAVKFLQYDHLFQSKDDFASGETMTKFNNLINRAPEEVQTHVEAIRDTFNQLKTDATTTYSNVGEVFNPLSTRLTCMNIFLNEHKDNKEACENSLRDFYQKLTSLSCGGKEVEDGDVFMLLTSKKIMKETNIHNPCDKYLLDISKFTENDDKLIRDSVADIKNAPLKAIEDILASYPGQKLRTKVLQNYFYAAAPVVTEYPQRANELAGALAEAHEEVYTKRASDEFWSGVYNFIAKAAAALGILSVVLWVIPPAGAVVSGITSALAFVAVAGGAFLAAGYGLEALHHERSEYAALERAIYSGGQGGDTEGLADTLKEWKEAERNAIWEGLFTVVGVSGARQLIRDPRALRTAYTKANLKDSWKSWREARKVAKEARKAAKDAEPVVRAKLNVARAKLKEAKVNLRQAKKNLKQNTDDNAVEALQENVDDLTREKADWLRLRGRYRDQLPKGRVKRASIWIRDGFVTQWNKLRPTKNVGTGRTIENADEIKGFFASAKDRIKTAHKNIYALNREAWKNSDIIKDMKKFAQDVEQHGGKIHWKLNKDGSAVFKADTVAHNGIMYNRIPVPAGAKNILKRDFKLGKDGYWIAVLTAGRLDELFGNRGKRAIEGGLQQIPGVAP